MPTVKPIALVPENTNLLPSFLCKAPYFKLWLRYADGISGTLDLSNLVGQGVFALWTDPAEFQKVHIGAGAQIAWNDEGEICADAAYLELAGLRPEDVFPALKDLAHA